MAVPDHDAQRPLAPSRKYDGINAMITDYDIGCLDLIRPWAPPLSFPTLLNACPLHGSGALRLSPALGALMGTYILASWILRVLKSFLNCIVLPARNNVATSIARESLE